MKSIPDVDIWAVIPHFLTKITNPQDLLTIPGLVYCRIESGKFSHNPVAIPCMYTAWPPTNQEDPPQQSLVLNMTYWKFNWKSFCLKLLIQLALILSDMVYQNYIQHAHRPVKMAGTDELSFIKDCIGNSIQLQKSSCPVCWANLSQALLNGLQRILLPKLYPAFPPTNQDNCHSIT